MKTGLIIILIVTLIPSCTYGQLRVIKGQLLNKDLMITGLYLKIDSSYIELYDINDSIDYSHISNDGCFVFKSDLIKCNSVLINFCQCTKLKIINIPPHHDTIDLGKIDLIRHKEISTKEYEEIKQLMIQSHQNSQFKQEYESYLSKKYKPLRDGICGFLYGYKCSDELERYQMINPWIENSKIEVNFDSIKDLIIIDYNEIKN